MSDIFISYSSHDRPWVQVLAEALRAEGWSVWWDRTTPTGSNYYRVIENELDAARCVVVVWSKESLRSDWVPAEAQEGLKKNLLIPITMEPCTAPLVFRHLQTADLRGWSGDRSNEQYRTVVDAIGTLLGQAPPPAPKEPERKRSGWAGGPVGPVLLAAIVLAGVGYGAWRMTGWRPAESVGSNPSSPAVPGVSPSPTSSPVAAPTTVPEPTPKNEPPAPPEETPVVAIERLAAEWMSAWRRGDIDAVVKLSSEPFYSGGKLVLTDDELKAQYLLLYREEGETWRQLEVTGFKVQTLRELQASGHDLTQQKIYSSLNLTLDDYAVTVRISLAGKEDAMGMIVRKTAGRYRVVGIQG